MRALVLAAASLLCFVSTTSAGEAPLLGASLTWTLHRNFRESQRDLTFTLRTAWKYGEDYGSGVGVANPGHNPGDRVSVREKFVDDLSNPDTGQRFGLLCYSECLDEDCETQRPAE